MRHPTPADRPHLGRKRHQHLIKCFEEFGMPTGAAWERARMNDQRAVNRAGMRWDMREKRFAPWQERWLSGALPAPRLPRKPWRAP